jgi:hypothetical protein
MTTLPYLVAASISTASIGRIAYNASRRRRTISQLVSKLELSRSNRLYPFVEGVNSSVSWDDDALWQAIGGREGIWKIHRECGFLMEISRNAKEIEPGCCTLAQDIFIKAFYLRGIMTWLALAEDFGHRSIPSIPRIHARSYARLYCDIASSLDTVLEVCGLTIHH